MAAIVIQGAEEKGILKQSGSLWRGGEGVRITKPVFELDVSNRRLGGLAGDLEVPPPQSRRTKSLTICRVRKPMSK